ncbi:hypothetical protein PV10_01531 [Exophiala mesophila]|uniref:Uncharacterized protein n=1 Tax=Exophiala mesophila TaxID=212818 RepID=A0A0D1X7J0_EXOME|nr:uncharacterized protein PV10_01531 [Exophiala mesophila]KIV97825.1 hypothetical protein PV10_01531 [Exophiala mesophila]
MPTIHNLAVVFSTLTITCVSTMPLGTSLEGLFTVFGLNVQTDTVAAVALADSATAIFRTTPRLRRHDHHDSTDNDSDTSTSAIPFYSLGPIPIITIIPLSSDDSTATSVTVDSISTTSSVELPVTTSDPSRGSLPDGILTLPPTTAINTYAPAFEPVPVPIAPTTTSSTDSPTQTTTVTCPSQLASTTSIEGDISSPITDLPVIVTVIPLPESSSSSEAPSSDPKPAPSTVPP